MAIENRLRTIRSARGLSLRELESLSMVSRSEIGSIETGRVIPRLDTAMMICTALDCTIEDVFALRE